jgi:DNA-binding FadR family transcriptional regulator
VTATSPMFHPITTQNAFEAVIEQVRTAVDLALLVPGDRLPPERELAALLDVSRPTVREALRVLARSGYVGIRRGSAGGTYVLERPRVGHADRVREALSARRRELSALLEWRRVVEAEAAALAATRISDDQLRALRARLVESGGRHVRSHGLWRAADSRFHIAIAEATGNPYMLDTVRKVRAELAHALDALILLKQAIEPAAAHEHEAILAALQARDPELARATAALHGRATEERLRAFLGSL